MRNKLSCLLISIFFIFSVFSTAQAVTAEEIIKNCEESYQRQIKNVKDLTEVTDKWTTYQKWVTINGKRICKTRYEMDMMGKKYISIYDGKYLWYKDPLSEKVTKELLDYSPYETIWNLKTAGVKYGGTEVIDANKTYILDIKDMSKLMPVTAHEEKIKTNSGKQKISGKIWVDAKDWVFRKIEVNIEDVDEEGKKITTKAITEMKDYRKVNGLFVAYKIVTRIDKSTAPKISQEELQEMRKNYEEMKKQLEGMPQEERMMVEMMVKPQIESMEKMFDEGGYVIEVKKVMVNTGLSDELFDGSKLK